MAQPGGATEPLVGQILSVGSRLNGQLIAVGGALASQISEKAKGGEEEKCRGGGVAEGTPPRSAPNGGQLPPA